MKKRFLLMNAIIAIVLLIGIFAVSGCYQVGRAYGVGCQYGCRACGEINRCMCAPACAGCIDGCLSDRGY